MTVLTLVGDVLDHCAAEGPRQDRGDDPDLQARGAPAVRNGQGKHESTEIDTSSRSRTTAATERSSVHTRQPGAPLIISGFAYAAERALDWTDARA
jgi:hypothetical protein